jgi:hypothetical protein
MTLALTKLSVTTLCHYAGCHVLVIVTLIVIMLCVVLLNVLAPHNSPFFLQQNSLLINTLFLLIGCVKMFDCSKVYHRHT